jgi:transposase
MFEVNDDAKGGYRRVEILTGPGRRRKWSAEEKGRVVAETLEPGARVSEVARRWQVCPQQVFGWRREARQEPNAAPDQELSPQLPQSFAPIVTGSPSIAAARRVASTAPVIEVKLAGAVIRVVSGSDDGTQLAAVLRAVRASAIGK